MATYKTFMTDKYHPIELHVSFHPGTLLVTSDEPFEMRDALKHIELTMSDVLKKQYPEHWDYIMVHENYGEFLTAGSPQMMECGWRFSFDMVGRQTSLTLSGVR